MKDDDVLAQKRLTILPHLNEKQRRLVLAAEARSLGYDGVSQVARATGISRPTFIKACENWRAMRSQSLGFVEQVEGVNESKQ